MNPQQALRGARVTFLGIVRADWWGDRKVGALCYEAYPEMAEYQMDRLVEKAKIRWLLAEVFIQHRLGRVDVGEVSMVVTVVTQHRAEAYAASEFLVEGIKRDVPIWKRNEYDDETSQWV